MAEENKTFMSGIMDGFSSIASNAGAIADAYNKIKGGSQAAATPGATGSGTPAATATGASGLNSTVKTILIGIGAALLLLIGIKVIRQ